MSIALVIKPRHTELDLPFGIYKALKDCITSELCLVCIHYGADRIQHLSDRLMELGLVWIFYCYLFNDLVNV